MRDRDIPGMGDYSPPNEPDEEKAAEGALIAAARLARSGCIDDLCAIAYEEQAVFFRSIGKDPALHAFGDWEGAWYEIYVKARDAFAEGERLEKLRKQGGIIRDGITNSSN